MQAKSLLSEGPFSKTVVQCCFGLGHVDMAAYDAYFNNELEDYEYPAAAIKESLSHLPKVG